MWIDPVPQETSVSGPLSYAKRIGRQRRGLPLQRRGSGSSGPQRPEQRPPLPAAAAGGPARCWPGPGPGSSSCGRGRCGAAAAGVMEPLRDCKVREGPRRMGAVRRPACPPSLVPPGPAAAAQARGWRPLCPRPLLRPGAAGVRPSGGRCPPVWPEGGPGPGPEPCWEGLWREGN